MAACLLDGAGANAWIKILQLEGAKWYCVSKASSVAALSQEKLPALVIGIQALHRIERVVRSIFLLRSDRYDKKSRTLTFK